jgi:signal transduction histidine kinase
VKFHAQRKNVQVNVDIQNNIRTIQADIDKTTWVLVNLLTNAIRYSPEDGNIDLRCEPNNGNVKISVQDYGPGIEEKYVTRLFEKFFQVPGSPSGTGLGLAISKEFIEAQGGEISVESEAGKGSTFYFNLPAVKGHGSLIS